MATLTETAYYARKFIKWGSLAFVSFIALRLLFLYTIDVIKKSLPPPPLKSNNLFGKLPQITFPIVATPSSELKYSLDTIEGSLPTASSAARVYFMPKNKINLLSLSKAQSFVDQLGFTSTPEQLDATLYRWTDLQYSLRTIDFEIVNNHFTLKYNYPFDLTIFQEKNLPSPAVAINEVFDFLQNLNLTPPDLDISKAKVTYLKLVGDQLEPTTSQSQGDAVKVELYRYDKNGVKIISDTPNTAPISLILSSVSDQKRRLLEVKYYYWPIDPQYEAIYKLKSTDKAYEELTAGQAYFAKFPQNNPEIKINEVYVALYDSINPQLFLQPVFVFSGENFAAYVPGIAPPWTE